MQKGANAALPNELAHLDLDITWDGEPGVLDASALLLNDNGKVRGDADFVFYNQPADEKSSVSYVLGGDERPAQRLAVTLSAVEAEVHTIAVIVSVVSGTLEPALPIALHLNGGVDEPLAEFTVNELGDESALLR